MPKVVDHEARREELLEATWRLIARDGLDQVTLRSIAVETGWSTGVLQHYFSSKQDIIASAHLFAYQRVADRISERSRGLTPRETLRVALEEALPLDDERALEARVEVSGWNLAMIDESFRAIHSKSVGRWRSALTTLLAEINEATPLRLPPTDGAELIIAFIDAMSAQAVAAPADTNAKRQRTLADALLQLIGA